MSRLRRGQAVALGSEEGARRGPVAPARRVDDLDRRIIEALQENGRASFRRIAAGLGVSEATVRARYARLVSAGILQVVGVTNPLGLGYEQALVAVKTSGAPNGVADEISRWPEADYVVATAGQFDVVVEIVASDRRHLLELTNRMRSLPDVVSTETFVYLEMWKQLYDWGSGMPKEETTR
jgi:Lrp/AsnC family transcriptional regulator, regulator for asnA, asnC and gidA